MRLCDAQHYKCFEHSGDSNEFYTQFFEPCALMRTKQVSVQTMTEAEHNRPIPKLFSNRPSASAAEVFGLLREPIIFFENNM